MLIFLSIIYARLVILYSLNEFFPEFWFLNSLTRLQMVFWNTENFQHTFVAVYTPFKVCPIMCGVLQTFFSIHLARALSINAANNGLSRKCRFIEFKREVVSKYFTAHTYSTIYFQWKF